MKLSISQATNLSHTYLSSLGFSGLEAKLITQNLLDAELAGKPTHGLMRLLRIKVKLDAGKVVTGVTLQTLSEKENYLHIDGQLQSGYAVIPQAIDQLLVKVYSTSIVMAGLTNLGYTTGYIGSYARQVTEKDKVFIGFHRTRGDMVTFGSGKPFLGTNPVTLGVPGSNFPVILDMATSKITWGQVLLARKTNTSLPIDAAVDANGKPTTDPNLADAVLPVGGYKGFGLSFMIELLAGAMLAQHVSDHLDDEWASFFIILDPSVFLPIDQFKANVRQTIVMIKAQEKQDGVSEIFVPGEQSYRKRQDQLKKDEIEIDDKVFSEIKGGHV